MALGFRSHRSGAILRMAAHVVGGDGDEAHARLLTAAPKLDQPGADVNDERAMIADESDHGRTIAPQVRIAQELARAGVGQLKGGQGGTEGSHRGGRRGHGSPLSARGSYTRLVTPGAPPSQPPPAARNGQQFNQPRIHRRPRNQGLSLNRSGP
jgi:hypothetical protein